MTIVKNGTPTGFQDRNGHDIKTADRIKHIVDGSILTIGKFSRAVSPLGFKYEIASMKGISRGMNPDGTYFAKLTDYELTDEHPLKYPGETVSPGDDVDNMAPTRVRDPRNKSLKKENWKKNRSVEDMEAEAVPDGCTLDEARRLLLLQDYQDEDLTDELRARGYHGEIKKSKTIRI